MADEVLKLRQFEKTQDSASEAGAQLCDACGAAMKPMGHCKYWCLKCGFLRTCNDVM
jgi:tRNA(Ile2) C34 agmatinyltransferase TiaS